MEIRKFETESLLRHKETGRKVEREKKNPSRMPSVLLSRLVHAVILIHEVVLLNQPKVSSVDCFIK